MPAIPARCPGCRKRLAVPLTATGRAVRCPSCRGLVPIPTDGEATVLDETAPDFSYLRSQDTDGDDILTAQEADDAESALSRVVAHRPTPPPPAAPAPPTVVYIPPPLTPAQPVPGLENQPPARPPAWVWPVLVALAVYAAVATGVGAWGWLRPSAPPPPANPSR